MLCIPHCISISINLLWTFVCVNCVSFLSTQGTKSQQNDKKRAERKRKYFTNKLLPLFPMQSMIRVLLRLAGLTFQAVWQWQPVGVRCLANYSLNTHIKRNPIISGIQFRGAFFFSCEKMTKNVLLFQKT